MKNFIIKILDHMPYIRGLKRYQTSFIPGHYYSTVPNHEDIDIAIKWASTNDIQGIDLNQENQINLLKRLVEFYGTLDYSEHQESKNRYHYLNNYFQHSDAVLLQTLVLYKRPKKIIEIGSGFSSALMLDIKDKYFKSDLELIFVEPYPEERLDKLLRESDMIDKSVKIVKSKVQDVHIEYFSSLSENDILFIDSSHVSKAGSDLNFLLFKILPVLKSGVLIHFHDVFFPFEYPENFLKRGFYWNENYLLQSFLMYNKAFEILFFNDFITKINLPIIDYFKTTYPLMFKMQTGSLWLKKI